MIFNDSGDPLNGYDIIVWDWNGPEWTFRVIGSSTQSPVRLDINKTKIQWHGKDNQVMRHGHLPGYCLISSLEPGDNADTAYPAGSGGEMPGTRPPWLYPALPGQMFSIPI